MQLNDKTLPWDPSWERQLEIVEETVATACQEAHPGRLRCWCERLQESDAEARAWIKRRPLLPGQDVHDLQQVSQSNEQVLRSIRDFWSEMRSGHELSLQQNLVDALYCADFRGITIQRSQTLAFAVMNLNCHSSETFLVAPNLGRVHKLASAALSPSPWLPMHLTPIPPRILRPTRKKTTPPGRTAAWGIASSR